MLDAHADFILGALAEAPDTTLDEMVERLRDERGVTVVRTAVWKLVDRHNQTYKKGRRRFGAGAKFRGWGVGQSLANRHPADLAPLPFADFFPLGGDFRPDQSN